ncbi:MAG TPA: hypothetical protein PK431_07320 [Chitinophagales bacterium]|nr:hypothetical protein [Chitinophagales bacterium]
MKNYFKKLTVLAIVVIAFYSNATAQTTFVVNEVRQFMSKGEQNGFEVILNGTKPDDAKDALEKWAKKFKGKVESSKKNPEIFIDNATISTVSANTVDIYAMIVPIDKGSKITVFVDLGGAFISSAAYGSQYSGMEAALKKLAKDCAINAVEDQIKSEEKVLKSLNGDLKDLTKDKADYIKDIEKAKKLIQEKEAAIQKNDADQSAKQQQISIQQQIIETVKTKRASLNY